MCRNIKQLRQPERPPTDEELYLAALQFVRKVSGYRKPSRKNQAAFEDAVQGVAEVTRELFARLPYAPTGRIGDDLRINRPFPEE